MTFYLRDRCQKKGFVSQSLKTFLFLTNALDIEKVATSLNTEWRNSDGIVTEDHD